MPPRFCPRCHNDLHTEDNGELTFCQHCGAPQIALSEDLRDRFEQQNENGSAELGGATPLSARLPETFVDPAAIVWSSALQLVALAGLISALLLLLQLAVAPVALLTLLWFFGAPIILLGVYCARNPKTRVGTGFGARLGLLTGLSIGASALTVETALSVVKRLVLHQGIDMDKSLAAALAQVQTQQMQQAAHGSAEQVDVVRWLQSYMVVPEFVVGGLLVGFLLFVVLYSLYSAITGSFSGWLRSRAALR